MGMSRLTGSGLSAAGLGRFLAGFASRPDNVGVAFASGGAGALKAPAVSADVPTPSGVAEAAAGSGEPAVTGAAGGPAAGDGDSAVARAAGSR